MKAIFWFYVGAAVVYFYSHPGDVDGFFSLFGEIYRTISAPFIGAE
jgi:hypothetical protein